MEGISRLLKLVCVSITVVLLLGRGDAMTTTRCRDVERQALIAFKKGLVDDSDVLFSWGGRDCCTWEGVYCSNQTGNVIKLDLYRKPLQGKMISPKLTELQHLQYLDLSWIYFNRSQFPEFIGSLTDLRYLALVGTYFGGRYPSQVGNLTHLQYLDLGGNDFASAENLNWLPRLSSLTYLDLSATNLSNAFDWPEAVHQLPKLTDLSLGYTDLPPILSTLSFVNASKSLTSVDLSWNHLTSPVFLWLSNHSTSLVYLDPSVNSLNGLIPDVFRNMSSLSLLDHSFSMLSSLQYLDLSSNDLSGLLPNLTKFSSLNSLDLSSNRLEGGIPESIGLMSNLEDIDFHANSLVGVISETHFSKLSKLLSLDLSSNSLVFDIHANWIPPFQLDVIILKSCKVGPNFPKWLQTQKSFSYLDISDAGISAILPSWFWGLCHNLTFLTLAGNQIRGTFESLTLEFAGSPELHLSSNQLEGPIPSVLSKASYLDLSNNQLSGSVSFLCESAASGLGFLNLSSNNVSGEVPDCLTHLENLVMLDLSFNALSGKIPSTIGSLIRIETLKLRSNRFVGELPSSLKNCTRLILIDVGDNELFGSIPKWIGGSFHNLVILMLSSNHFNGSMPSQLCHLTRIQILDVSANNISGSIPQCIENLTALAQKGNSSLNITHFLPMPTSISVPTSADYEDDATFIWKGRRYSYKKTLGLVKAIDFSSNILTGKIPSEITHLVGLVSLNLSRNQLTGQISPDIGKLDSLDSLDLSRNQIGGRIPTSLARIDRLGFLDLSYNDLSGKIPIGTQLQSFDPSAYAGNRQLCGPPLTKPCDSKQTLVNNEEDKNELISRGFYITMGIGFIVGFWGACGSLIFIRSWRYTFFNFFNVLRDWLYVRTALIKRRCKRDS